MHLDRWTVWRPLPVGVLASVVVIATASVYAPVSGIVSVVGLLALVLLGPLVASLQYLWLMGPGDQSLGRRLLGFAVIAGLGLVIAVSPEVPLGFPVGGREFTIRTEDVFLAIIVLLAPLWLRVKSSVYLPPYSGPLFLYLVVAIAVSGISLFVTDLSLARTSVYLLKEVEFFLIAVVMANAIGRKRELRLFIAVILIGGLLNASWAGWQLVTGEFGPLFFTAAIEKERYGASLLGQPAVLASGAFYLAPIFLAMGILLTHEERRHRWLAVGLLTCYVIAMLGAVSRASIVATFLTGVGLLLWSPGSSSRLGSPPVRSLVLTTGAVALLIAGAALHRVTSRFQGDNLYRGIATRIDQWVPLFDASIPYALIGYGKGSLGQVLGFREAHNHYLRVFIEMGVLGLVVFLLLLLAIIRVSHDVVVSSDDRVIQTVGIACLGVTVSMFIIAFVQDVFINVKVSEMLWLVAGAMAAAWRIHQEDDSREGTPA